MQHPALGVAAFASEVQLALAPFQITLIEMHPEFHQILDAGRPLRDNRPDNRLVAKPRPGFERVAHVQVERIFPARNARHTPLGVTGVGFRP